MVGGEVASDESQQWNKWTPGTKWEPGEKLSVHEEGGKMEEGETQGGAQSSHEVWSNPDENHQGTQTISDEDKTTAVAKKKARRGKLRFRFGKRDRAREKEQRDLEEVLEERDQTSSAVDTVEIVKAMEVPRSTTNDEGSL